jgi:hypothetical protein
MEVCDVIIESVWLKFDPNVDITLFRIEVFADSGAEDGEAAHVVRAAEFDDLGLLGGDERLQGGSSSDY